MLLSLYYDLQSILFLYLLIASPILKVKVLIGIQVALVLEDLIQTAHVNDKEPTEDLIAEHLRHVINRRRSTARAENADDRTESTKRLIRRHLPEGISYPEFVQIALSKQK